MAARDSQSAPSSPVPAVQDHSSTLPRSQSPPFDLFLSLAPNNVPPRCTSHTPKHQASKPRPNQHETSGSAPRPSSREQFAHEMCNIPTLQYQYVGTGDVGVEVVILPSGDAAGQLREREGTGWRFRISIVMEEGSRTSDCVCLRCRWKEQRLNGLREDNKRDG